MIDKSEPSNNKFETDLLTLIDDAGEEHEFEIIDELDNDDGHFLALVPTMQSPKEISETETYFIFEMLEIDGEECLQELDDDELLDKIANIFENRFNDAYYNSINGDES